VVLAVCVLGFVVGGYHLAVSLADVFVLVRALCFVQVCVLQQ
jgi:hypothetical protein